MREFLAAGARVTPQQLAAARERREIFTAKLTDVIESVDAIAGPSGGDPAWPITHAIQVGSLPDYHKAGSVASPRSADFTMPMDLAGVPAICLPCGFLRTVCRTVSSSPAGDSVSRCCAESPMPMSGPRIGTRATRA